MSKTIDEPTDTQRSSFFDEPKDLATLAREQGAKPFDFDAFRQKPRLFPESESADELIAAVREWRKEGKESR